jgi:putative ABC transport system permease protein
VQQGRFGGGGFSPQLAADLRRLPEVSAAAGFGDGVARIAGSDSQFTVAEPADVPGVMDLDVREGSIAALGADGIAVSEKRADDKGWRLGTSLDATWPDGARSTLTVRAVYDAREIIGDQLVARAAWKAHAVQSIDSVVLVTLADGTATAAGKAAVKRAVAPYGAPDVQDRGEYVDSVAGMVDQMLGLVYVMLLLAIIIALMGIANTLALSIHERTRELGMLRAVGQTRGQLRSMIRWESVIISTFGTVAGVGLGVFLGWALVRAASTAQGIGTFAAPVGQLAIVVMIGAVVGLVAGYRPARRAGRIDVLAAIATE